MDSWYKLQGIPDKEGDDTHFGIPAQLLGLVGQKKHKQWTMMVQLWKFITRRRKVYRFS